MIKPRYRYQDFLDELARGTQYGVFIDDTGSPGLDTGHLDLHPERASWVAVIVPPVQMPEVLRQFPGALEELEKLTGAKEFHFAEIYAGRREYRNVDPGIRLAFFRLMAKLFAVYGFPVIVQTFDPKTLAIFRDRAPSPDLVAGFDFRKPKDAALFLLLVRVKSYLEQQQPRRVARVFIDEGYKKNGKAIQLPSFAEVFADGLLCFAKSSAIHPIQLADFAAFSMNRTQLLIGRAELSEIDRSLLEILSPIAVNFINIEKNTLSLENWSKPTRGM